MAYQDDNQKRQMFDDTSIADSRDQEQVLRGIQPKNQLAYRIYRIFRTLGIFALIFGAMGFGVTFIPNLKAVTSNSIFRWGIILFIGLAILLFLLMFLVKLLFLRKCPFDDWVFEVAQRDLGTDLIFYTSRCLYIKYDIASAKEVDKRDFVTRMSDLSLHYSYFFVDSFPDQQVIQVECTKKQPIPTRAMLEPDDDLYPNIIPIGLTINNYSQRVSPIAWVLNDNNKNPNILETPPSVSFLIAGGTGCHALGEEILMADNSIKKVEDIRVGDLIMGPDRAPREVLELHRGQDEMYEIETEDGDKHIVNGGHILPLYDIETKEIINMPVNIYLFMDDDFKSKVKIMKV